MVNSIYRAHIARHQQIVQARQPETQESIRTINAMLLHIRRRNRLRHILRRIRSARRNILTALLIAIELHRTLIGLTRRRKTRSSRSTRRRYSRRRRRRRSARRRCGGSSFGGGRRLRRRSRSGTVSQWANIASARSQRRKRASNSNTQGSTSSEESSHRKSFVGFFTPKAVSAKLITCR